MAVTSVLELRLAEDFYLGDAQFTVAVDGVQVGNIYTVTALRGSEQTFVFTSNFGTGPHVVTLNFLNDAYAGTPDTDRNLIVEGITFDGVAVLDSTTILYGSESRDFAVLAPPVSTDPTNGPDVLTGGDGDDLILARGGDDRIYGLGGNDTLYGELGDDVIEGGDGNDVLEGGPGRDTTIGGPGDDIHVVEGYGETLIELAGGGIDTVIFTGNDFEYFTPGNIEVVVSSDAGQRVYGNFQNQTIFGNGGADVLRGFAGDDVLVGGSGVDTFLFQGWLAYVSSPDEGRDVVADFTQGEDIIRLEAFEQRTFADVLSVATQQGDDVVLALTSTSRGLGSYGTVFNEYLVVQNISLAQLSPSDFGGIG